MGQGQQRQGIKSQPKTTISLPHSKSKVNEALSPKGGQRSAESSNRLVLVSDMNVLGFMVITIALQELNC